MSTKSTCAELERRVLELERECFEHKHAAESLKASLIEQEALVRETHHRVKNNMQIISSLLDLQQSEIADKDCQAIVQESQSRIKAMSLIHEELYRSPALSNVQLKGYVTKLAHSLVHLYCTCSTHIAVRVEPEELRIRTDLAVSCGLILNELISNSLKYAFPAHRPGRILIEVRASADDELLLVVSDDGVGLPEMMDIRESGTLGLELVTNLVEKQLGGKLETCRQNGTQFKMRFKCSSNVLEAEASCNV